VWDSEGWRPSQYFQDPERVDDCSAGQLPWFWLSDLGRGSVGTFEGRCTGTGPVLRCKPGTGCIDLEQRSQHYEILGIPQIRNLAFLLVVFGAITMTHQDFDGEMCCSASSERKLLLHKLMYIVLSVVMP
jgi:hypothetical protein